ncbi:MAG: winged helix-turn-helix domain-containing protein [Clostridia bacterium]
MPLLKRRISKQWGIYNKASSLYDVVHNLGFSLQRPKKQSRNAKKELQEQFKADIRDLLETCDDDTVILYQDEAVITDESTAILKWAPKGKQPIVPTDNVGSRERFVMFGAVNPVDGKVHYSTSKSANTNSLRIF